MARNDVNIRVGANTAPASAAFAKLKSTVGGFTGGLLGGAGLVYALGKASDMAGQFELAMAEVSTLLDDTSGLEKTTNEVREIARQFGTAPTDQAKALYQIISSGAAEAGRETELLTVANRLAIGGITDVETAADGLTSILNAYNLESSEAGRISDGLFASMKAGKTTIEELSQNLGQVTPIAATAGVEFEEVAAATAALTKSGVSTSEAVTQLRGIISAVAKPNQQAIALAKELGIEWSVQALQAKGLTGFMRDVQVATQGNVEANATLFGRIQGLQGALQLIGGQAESYSEILNNVRNSTGQTDAAFAKIAGTSDFIEKRFKASFASLGESFGRIIQATSPLLDAMTDVINSFDHGGDSAKDAEKKIAEASESIGDNLNVLVGAGQILAGGFKSSFNLAQIAFNSLAAGIADTAAVIAKGLSIVTLGDVSRGFQEAATLLENRATELKQKIDRDLNDINDAGETVREGFARMSGSLDAAGAKAEEIAPKMDLLVISQDEYNEAMGEGIPLIQQNTAETEKNTKAKQQNTSETEQGAVAATDLVTAYEKLGITSTDSLTKTAQAMREQYDVLVRGRAPIEDLNRAWAAVAQAELAAAEAAGQAEYKATLAALNASAKTQEQREILQALIGDFDEAGAAGESFGDRVAGSVSKASGEISSLSDRIEATKDRLNSITGGSGTGPGGGSQGVRGAGSTGLYGGEDEGSGLSGGTRVYLGDGYLEDLTGLSDQELQEYIDSYREVLQSDRTNPMAARGRKNFNEDALNIALQEQRSRGQLSIRKRGAGDFNTTDLNRTITINFTRQDGTTGSFQAIDSDGAEAFLQALEASGGVAL